MVALFVSLLIILPINGLILLGIVRQRRMVYLERTAKIEAYNSMFRFKNWRDR